MGAKRSAAYCVKNPQGEKWLIEGRFRTNATTTPDNTLNKGLGWSVARTGVGLYTITFKDKFTDLISADAWPMMGTATDTAVVAGTYTTWTASAFATLAITVLTAGVAADIASNANNWVAFSASFLNSLNKPTKGFV